jgi:nicotinate-nucleotide adenylyltransferase
MSKALFFGSFNPVHLGHTAILSAVLSQTNIAEIWMMVSPQNPFKKNADLEAFSDRYEMAKLAVRHLPQVLVSDLENDLPKPSFTMDTLRVIKKKWPHEKWSIVLGEDQLADFYLWKEPEKILSECELIVFPRKDARPYLASLAPHLTWIDAPYQELSATVVRQKLKTKTSLTAEMDQAVLDYIEEHQLYK